MIHVPPAAYRRPYEKPLSGLLAAGFGSELEMDCLHGLIRTHLDRIGSLRADRPPRLFEIGTHRGAGLCHFHAMAPELELHSLNVLPSQLAALPRQMPDEIIAAGEIGSLARERGVPFTQHLADSRRFSWDALAAEGRFDIVFIDGCHESFTVVADTLNALRILEPDGLLIWHDCKAVDGPGRAVLAALHDLDAHEFAGAIRHIEQTWLAFAPPPADPPESSAAEETGRRVSREEPLEQARLHLAGERRAGLRDKVRALPSPCEVVFFSDHRRPDWPDDQGLGTVPEGYRASRDPRRVARADVVVFHLPDAQGWHRLPRRKHQVWIGVTLEPDGYYPWQADPDRLATLDLLLSHHRHADVPLGYAPLGGLPEMRRPVPAKDPAKLICAFISNPHSVNQRERLVEAFERYLPVHHFGRWRHNQPGPSPQGREGKLGVLRQYQFCLAIENCLEANLVTEKWYDCLVAGCVPVYLGAPNINAFLPGEGCFVDLRPPLSLAEAAARIREAAARPREYARFFEWKRAIRPEFARLVGDQPPDPSRGLMVQIDEVLRKVRASGWPGDPWEVAGAPA